MAKNFDNPYAAEPVGLWDFRNFHESEDSGLGDGLAQDGTAAGGASFGAGWLYTNFGAGHFDVNSGHYAAFDLAEGTVVTSFRPYDFGPEAQTVLSRGHFETPENYFEVSVTADRGIALLHTDGGQVVNLQTAPGFLTYGDIIEVTYTWGPTGVTFSVNNETQGSTVSLNSDQPEMGFAITEDGEQSFVFGAREVSEGIYDQGFNGSIDYVAVYDCDVSRIGLDGVVEGTEGDDFIDAAYLGDPEGDRVDAGDALDPVAGPDDDRIEAGAGDDTVTAGVGNDTLIGGAGADQLFGGADRDTFVGATDGDVIDGGTGGADYDVLDLSGLAFEYASRTLDADGNSYSGTINLFDAAGDVSGTFAFSEIERMVPCFTPGTLIATPRGEIAVEELKVGDRVITRDNGIQMIRWVGMRRLGPEDLKLASHLQPVLIRQGALGNGLPERDMMVSPNHRVLVANDKTALYFEDREVLVAAKHLTGLRGVDQVQTTVVTYIHFMFDQHEVVLSDGAWTESFQPGDQSLRGLDNGQRNEIFELFPDLKSAQGRAGYSSARRSLKRHEAKILLH